MNTRNKRGVNPTPLLGIGILLFALLILYNIFSAVPGEEQLLGARQYDLLLTNERAENAQYYIDLAGQYSAQRAFDELLTHAGLYETAHNPTQQYQRCGRQVYPAYNSPQTDCTPQFYNNYRLYLNQYMNNYLNTYKDIPLASNFQIDIITQQQQTGLAQDKAVVTAKLGTPQQLPLLSKTLAQASTQQGYPEGLLGGYGTEKPVRCATGTCFAQVAEYFHDLYEAIGHSLPYVIGGESPYSYEDTIALQAPGKLFAGVDVTQTEPQSSVLTKPGFDSAGYLWWVGKHASIQTFEQRRDVDEYYAILQANGAQELCKAGTQEPCTRDFILANAQAGDLLFSHQNNGWPTQVLISLGSDTVVYAKPGYGVTKENLPTNYALGSVTEIEAVLRMNYPATGQDTLQGIPTTVTQSQANSSQTQTNSCQLNIDFSQINRQAIRHARSSYDDVEAKLEQYNAMQYINEAHAIHPRVPKEFIIAIINTEVGGGSTMDAFLTGQQRCNSAGYCSVMQIGKSACDTVTQQGTHRCDYDYIKTGAIDGSTRDGILSGTAYLDWLITAYPNYINPNNPNYYFVAMAYNYGVGTLHEVMKAASARTGIQLLALEWKDITYDDVANGGKAIKQSWANDPNKWEEAFEYPNLVATALSQECTGVYYAGVGSIQTTRSKLGFTPQFEETITADFEALDMLTDFVKDIKTCDDNLRQCVQTKVKTFNQQYQPRITITQNEEPDALAYDLIGQLEACYANEQENCTCVFTVNYTLPTRYEDLAIEITHDGEISVGEREYIPSVREGLKASTKERVTILPLLPTMIFSKLGGNIVMPSSVGGSNLLTGNIAAITGRVTQETQEDDGVRKVAIVGSSSTAAQGGYVDMLADKGFGDVLRFAHSGDTTSVVRDRFPDVLASNPDVVVIFNGVNDLPTTQLSMTNAKTNLQLMINDAKQAGIQTVLVTIQPTGSSYYWDGTTGREPELVKQKTEELNNWMLYQAQNVDVVVDAYSVLGSLSDPTILNPVYEAPTKDGIHLNTKGHEVLADVIYTQARDVLIGEQTPTPQETITIDPEDPLASLPEEVTAQLKDSRASVARVIAAFVANPVVGVANALVGSFSANPQLRVPDYIELFIDTKQETTSIEWDDGLRDKEWVVGKDIDSLGAVKLTPDIISWVQYKEGQEHLQCKDNKHYFRFQAHFDFTTETIDFSVYLNDTTPPPLNLQRAQLGLCRGDNAPILSWTLPANTEGIDTFGINWLVGPQAPTRTPYDYATRIQTAQEIQTEDEIKDIKQLYVKKTKQENTYYYMMQTAFADEPFIEGNIYYYEIQAIDAYGNTLPKAQRGELDLQTISPNMFLTTNTIAGTIASIVDNCDDATKKQKTINEVFGVQTPISEDTTPPPEYTTGTQVPTHQYEIYPGVNNPETGEPLYKIANIPNVICDEADTTVGKVCAGNLEMVEQLVRISEEILQPEGLVMYVTQAFRTWDIQNNLWVKYGQNPSRVCNPGTPTQPRKCPHMIAGAIDISIRDQTTQQRIPYLDQEGLMCRYGFVRYGGEEWHFEYGTNQWRIAEQQRISNPQYCYYGTRDAMASLR